MDIKPLKDCEDIEDLLKIIGKKVVDIAVGKDGFDLYFDDGTVLEVYCFENKWGYVVTTEEEIKKEEEEEDTN